MHVESSNEEYYSPMETTMEEEDCSQADSSWRRITRTEENTATCKQGFSKVQEDSNSVIQGQLFAVASLFLSLSLPSLFLIPPLAFMSVVQYYS